MNYRIFRKNNYIYVIDENGKFFAGLAKEVVINKTDETSSAFFFKNIRSFDQVLKLENILKQDTSPYTAQEWEDFYTLNTGFNSPQESGVNTGFIDVSDTQYTEGSPLTIVADTPTIIPNNAGLVYDSQKPLNRELFSAGKIVGRQGDGVLITVDLLAKPLSASPTPYVEIWFDITGGTGLPVNLANLYRRPITFPKGANIERPINFTVGGYQRNTWEANGADVYIQSNVSLEIYAIRFVPAVYHSGRVES